MRKPDGCIGCSLYGDGEGFVPGVHPLGATVKLIGQSPDEADERAEEPFVGKTGKQLEQHYLPILGMRMAEVARDNVLRCRWQPTGKRYKVNEAPSGRDLTLAMDHCRQYDCTTPDIRLVLLLGDPVLKRYYTDLKAGDWVGFLLPEKDVK